MVLRVAMLGACVVFTGCASITNDSHHPVRVDTRNSAGQVVTGADCRLTNDGSTQSLKSGDSAAVKRSSGDLDISCKHPEHPDALGRLISRVNAGLFGNIIFGGGIGMVIDHSRGTAYTYPSWVQLVFGKTLTFDRSAEVDGQPVPGVEPGTPPTTARASKIVPTTPLGQAAAAAAPATSATPAAPAAPAPTASPASTATPAR